MALIQLANTPQDSPLLSCNPNLSFSSRLRERQPFAALSHSTTPPSSILHSLPIHRSLFIHRFQEIHLTLTIQQRLLQVGQLWPRPWWLRPHPLQLDSDPRWWRFREALVHPSSVLEAHDVLLCWCEPLRISA